MEDTMSSLTSDPVFRAYAVSAVVLGLNMLVIANGTALTRARHKEVINPEDQKTSGEAKVVFDGGNDTTSRYRRAHRNALENIPLFLASGLLLALVGAPPAAAFALFGVFVAARVLHSVCYVKGVQPFRTISFVVGLLAQTGVLGLIAYGVLHA
jgi:microsomal prostaglandin-E synthase 1